ncbi:hypothetical protein LCGC14_2634030 [marine sediment metagenome]|uniref:Uncharacterized protein n=1 Tax=marine sediment metagenome TaxID=412755 RepID=A0A0F9CRV0_9ZZZZ
MAQQEKITKKLDLKKSAVITGVRILKKDVSYTLSAKNDSGSYIAANNSSLAPTLFTLPALADCNGQFWNFFSSNATSFHVLSPASNAFVSDYGVNTLGVNFGHISEGQGCRVICDGSKYYLVGATPFASAIQANVSYQQP